MPCQVVRAQNDGHKKFTSGRRRTARVCCNIDIPFKTAFDSLTLFVHNMGVTMGEHQAPHTIFCGNKYGLVPMKNGLIISSPVLRQIQD